MLSMEEKKTISDLFHQRLQNISEIAKTTGHDRKTVRRVLTERDTIPKPKPVNSKSTKITPYKNIIDGWLEEDRKAMRKQRHTAKRVYVRLQEQFDKAFNCSYRTIANYIKQHRKDHYPALSGYLPLSHSPGTAQVDFGSAEFYEAGILHKGHYLTLSLPYSNAGYLQVFKGENTECLLSGMQNIFHHLKGVPHRIIFDNASSMVVSISQDKKRKLTEAFSRFSLYYGFVFDFCNPASGNEKGSVENKVGYLRRNLLVPVPKFQNIEDFNKELLSRCDQDNRRKHYKKDEQIDTLLEDDKKKFLYLPKDDYEIASYDRVRVNGYGKFTLNYGKHTYSASPKFAGLSVTVKKTAHFVEVLDEKHKTVVKHNRLYGPPAESMNWIPYLKQLACRPKAIKYTDVLTLLPQPVQDFFNTADDRKKESDIMRALAEITEKSSFKMGVQVIEQAISCERYDKDSIQSIYKRMTNQTIELPPLEIPESLPKLGIIKIDPNDYNSLLPKIGGHNA